MHTTAPPVPLDSLETEIKVVRQKASPIQFLRDPVQFFHKVADHDGALTQVSLGNRDFFVVSNPSIIRDILSTRGSLFEKYPAGNPKQKLFGNGLLTSEGAAQKQQRRMLLPAFHRDRLQIYAAQIIACVNRMVTTWRSGACIEMAGQMNDVTLEIIGRTLLGVDDRQVMQELGGHLHTMLNLANRFVVPWGNWLMNVPLPSTLRYRRATIRLNQMVAGLIDQEKRQPRPDNLIRVLLDSRHSDGTELTDVEVRDEIVTMIVAGHETVAVGLMWSLYLLAQHPEMQEDLAEQVKTLLGNREAEAEDYTRLESVQHAFAEALRLHPPIWILGRRNLEEYSFRNFQAPAQSIFLVCMADLHRRPELFTDASLFKPDRWTAPDWPAYAYIPFGGGERRCIGERFAWMEAVLVLTSLLKRWRFSLLHPEPLPSVAKLTLHPRGPVRLKITDRTRDTFETT